MTIVKEGAFRKREYNHTCRYCGCQFIFNEDEVIEREQSRGGFIKYVRCPWCNHTLYVSQTIEEQNRKYENGDYAR